MTSKASSMLPPKRSGCASGSMMFMNSTTEPGQPCVMSSGMGAGPLPFSWMKCISTPCTGALKCAKRFIAASCWRQSYCSTQ